MNLVDSSGWLEYFAAGSNSDFFASSIEDTENLIVSTVNIYEVFKKILIEKSEHSALQAVSIMQQALVRNVDSQTALLAASLSHAHKIPMADGLILATARLCTATLWTQDSDLRNFSEVRYVEKI